MGYQSLYSVQHQFDENDYLIWYVHENLTNQIVGKFLFEDDAEDYRRFLDHGGGFAGFTPSFILNRVNLAADINEAFSVEFAL